MQVRDLWNKITLRRHRSELQALRIARSMGPLAIFPILFTVGFWWFALALPVIVIGIPALSLLHSDEPIERSVGWSLYAPLSIYAIIVLALAAPWFFRWYFIAVGLTLGRPGMADRKEAELITAIAANSRAN